MSVTVIALLFNLFSGDGFSNTKMENISEISSVSTRGTVSFVIETDKTYRNGTWEHEFRQDLVELPGLGKSGFIRTYNSVMVAFNFLNGEDHTGFFVALEELPGPSKYHFLFTWDAEKGLADAYINGILFRTENPRYYKPWEVKGIATSFRLPPGPIHVSGLGVFDTYIPEDRVAGYIPKTLIGRMVHTVKDDIAAPPIDLKGKKGVRIYTSRLAQPSDIEDWVMEGPGEITFVKNVMQMRSTIPEPPQGTNGHFNVWCPVEFPEKFIAEWEYRPVSEYGISLIFFAAKGMNGEDIFDSSLPKRDGNFQKYINDVIKNYWIIYYSNHTRMRTSNIATTYICKSGKSSLCAMGRIGIMPGDDGFHHLRLIKDGPHIQFQVDGKVVLDFIDPGTDRWGSILGSGKFSFRQMAFTVGAYRNFSVWKID